MYATLSYDVNAGALPIENVRQAILDLFGDRDTCDLLSDTLICSIENGEDFQAMAKKVRKVGTDFPDQFIFVLTLHRTSQPLRANGNYPKAKASAIIDGEE